MIMIGCRRSRSRPFGWFGVQAVAHISHGVALERDAFADVDDLADRCAVEPLDEDS